MNNHYLELVSCLEEAETHPEVLLDRNHEVFLSERRLYEGMSKVTNCRLRLHTQLPLASLIVTQTLTVCFFNYSPVLF